MKKTILILAVILVISLLFILYRKEDDKSMDKFTKDSTVKEVINYKNFGTYGRLIFPVDINIPGSTKLKDLNDYYPWYTLNSDRTVEVVNYLKDKADNKDTIFYNIYTNEEMKKDPSKRNTGLFYFRGKENNRFALVSAGGGFMYVGAMQDSFPHALELSKRGINAFAIIYRPDSNLAMEDLSRSIAFIFKNKDKLKVDTSNYSLWGGSAGARMTDIVGTYGTKSFGEDEYPKPSAIIMQYTGLSDVTGKEPPTYVNVGTSDNIANYKVMEDRINKIKKNGTNAKIEIFKGLSHGFGVGDGTIASGWIDNAIDFWNENSR